MLDSQNHSPKMGGGVQRTDSDRAVTFDAFISYSHAADGKFAPALRDGLQRFATPWGPMQWEASTGREIKVLRGHERQVFAVAFTLDGSILATGSGDGTARLWEVATGREVAVLRGHENYVWSVAFTPDGGTLATGSSDNTVRLWDVASASEIGILDGRGGQVFGGAVLAVAFSPDGHILASASAGSPSGPDHPRVWDRPRLWPFGQGLLDHACARIQGLPFQTRDQLRFVIQRQWCTPDVSSHLAAN